MKFCIHRWSNVKRWNTSDGVYHIIQRCRRCNTFVRKDIDLKANGLGDKLVTVRLDDRNERIIVPVEEEISESAPINNQSLDQVHGQGNDESKPTQVFANDEKSKEFSKLLQGSENDEGLENSSSNNEIPNAHEHAE